MPRPRKFPTDEEIRRDMLKIAMRVFRREFERAVQIARREMSDAARTVAPAATSPPRGVGKSDGTIR